jgi:hypothetical protein
MPLMLGARALVVFGLPMLGACAPATAAVARPMLHAPASSALAPASVNRARPDPAAVPLPGDIAHAIEIRVAELSRRGGACAVYASVMKRSYREGRILLRPFMWRVEGRLVSGQATADGDMVLARDIDPLNVGLRTVDDVLWSAEHESAHIAFRIANDEVAGQDPADRYVRECRSAEYAETTDGRG